MKDQVNRLCLRKAWLAFLLSLSVLLGTAASCWLGTVLLREAKEYIDQARIPVLVPGGQGAAKF